MNKHEIEVSAPKTSTGSGEISTTKRRKSREKGENERKGGGMTPVPSSTADERASTQRKRKTSAKETAKSSYEKEVSARKISTGSGDKTVIKRRKSREKGENQIKGGDVCPDSLSTERDSTQRTTTTKATEKIPGSESVVAIKVEPNEEEYVEVQSSKKIASKSSGKKTKNRSRCHEEAEGTSKPSKAKKAKRRPKSEELYKEEKKEGVRQPPQKEALVYCEGDDIWDCKLYQTNIGKNNNKYILLQLRKENGENAYCVWERWGRVGTSGQKSEKSHGDHLENAKKEFKKKFKEKTGNNWDQRKDFKKVPGKYHLLAIDYELQGSNDPSAMKLEKEESDLSDPSIAHMSRRLQRSLLIEICPLTVILVVDGEYRYRLKSEQILEGKSSLDNIEILISSNCNEEAEAKLTDACNDFYTKFPHDFRKKKPELITDKEAIARTRERLEELDGKIMNSLEFWIERT